MDPETAAALGEAWRDDYPWEFITRLTEIGDRMGGSPGERRAADLVAEGFERAGAREVEVESFEMTRWTRGDAELAVTDPVERSFETIALPYSPAGEVSGELVDAGHGTPEELDAVDVAGNIVVASTTTPKGSRFIHRMEKFGHAAAAGAEAFVFRNHKAGQLPPTGSLRFDREAAIPGVGVSLETGDWLTDYAERGGRGRLRVDAETTPGTSHNAHGKLGPDTDEEIVVVAHHDAHDIAEGALDNGCGITVVVAAAHLLAELDLDTRVRVAGVGCEETGLLGADALAERSDLDSVRAVVNVDGAGRFRDLRAHPRLGDDGRDSDRGRRRGEPAHLGHRAGPPVQRPLAVPPAGRPRAPTPQPERRARPRVGPHSRRHARQGGRPKPARTRDAGGAVGARNCEPRRDSAAERRIGRREPALGRLRGGHEGGGYLAGRVALTSSPP
mgnify:CR=1 FL=1